ncbi:MAG: DUF1566 domain-containing protein, partial [Deltaproteobacteria bacterium]|nr:DUF1566 domain-containing protein [Deltaproteobacteria bacterium]
GLGIAVTSTVVAVSQIGNHDHFISQILGADKERINLDTKKLNAIDCARSNEKSSDDNSSINSAANCWEISTRTSAPTNFIGDVTYIDKRTGFMWSSMINDTDGMTVAQAITNCDTANIKGFTDWRLPTISEFFEAIYHGYFEVVAGTDEDGDGSLTDNWDSEGDGSLTDELIRSSTAYSLDTTASFHFTFNGWNVSFAADTDAFAGYSARCVRTAR